MKYKISFFIIFTLIILLLAPSLAAAIYTEEAAQISVQVNDSDRIIIGTVSEIDEHKDYTITTIKVKEWLYNPLPLETIKIRTEIGTDAWTEDEAFFTQNESLLLMLEDKDTDKQLFRVVVGFLGEHPVSDRDAVIEELKAQGKWLEESEISNKTNDTEEIENKGAAGKQERNSDSQKSNRAPFISSIWVSAVVLVAVNYVRNKK